MPFPQQYAQPFTREAIEALWPDQNGVYGIFNNTTWIYIGRGDIRDRLLAHFNGTGGRPEILDYRPTGFLTEVTAYDVAREIQLIAEFDPVCNRTAGG